MPVAKKKSAQKPKPKPLSKRIQALLDTGIAPAALATEIGISPATLYRWRAEDPKRPSRLALESLARVEKAHLTA